MDSPPMCWSTPTSRSNRDSTLWMVPPALAGLTEGIFQMDTEYMRYLSAHLAAGVAVVSGDGDDGPRAWTTTTLLPVSFDPPLLAVCIDTESGLGSAITHAKVFAVSVLPARRADIADFFSESISGESAPGPYVWRAPADNSPPVLADAIAWFVCDLVDIYPVGDHTLCLGAVRVAEVAAPYEDPLTRFRDRYRLLGRDISIPSPATPTAWFD